MPLATLTRLALGALACSPLPAAGWALHLASGGDLTSPALLALALVPGLGVAGTWAFLHHDQRRTSQVRALEDQIAAATDARRALAAEVAQLQGLELGLLADLEAAEAEVHARDAVLGSLAEALTDNLSAVDGALHRLAQGQPPRDAERLRSLSQQVAELIELVEDARALGQGGSDPGTSATFVLAEALDAATEAARDTLGGVEVRARLDGDFPREVVGDPRRLHTLVIAAAREAARAGAEEVGLTLRRVERSGALGLRIAWAEAEEHGLADGLGARLVESLGQPPVLGARPGSVTWWIREVEPSGSVVPHTLPAARVLLAATDPANRARITRLLSRWGLEVVGCRSAAEAMGRLELETVDLVLLDLEQDGLPVLHRLRANRQHAHLPVLLLSPDLDNLVWLRGPGDALTRPVRQSALEEEVAEVLALPANGSQAEPRRPLRILAWEPNPVLAATLVRYAAAVGVEVVCAASARGITTAALRGPWDLVLVDLHAEGLEGGLATLDRALSPDVVRLAITARPSGIDRSRAQDLGLIDAVPRPMDPDAFARLLSLVIDLQTPARRA